MLILWGLLVALAGCKASDECEVSQCGSLQTYPGSEYNLAEYKKYNLGVNNVVKVPDVNAFLHLRTMIVHHDMTDTVTMFHENCTSGFYIDNIETVEVIDEKNAVYLIKRTYPTIQNFTLQVLYWKKGEFAYYCMKEVNFFENGILTHGRYVISANPYNPGLETKVQELERFYAYAFSGRLKHINENCDSRQDPADIESEDGLFEQD